ncbi:MAG: hypothetical protein K6E94_05895 [Elusimicrobiaceae bacterium]|nr:hypothetical protein [Elusimicrobiaceae bacterium]
MHSNRMPIFNINVPFSGSGGRGGDFSSNIKKAKIMLYFMLPIFCLTGIFVMNLGMTSMSLSCKYDQTKYSYNCQLFKENILMGKDTINISDIEKAVVSSRRGDKSTLYQVQLINVQGEHIPFDNSWTNLYFSVNKKAEKLNKYFSARKDFSYDFGTDWFIILFSVPFILFPIIMLLFFKHITNNYIFQEVRPGEYQAISKIKGIGKMNLPPELMERLSSEFAGKQMPDNQFHENSYRNKDAEFIEKDVDDLTKQFYEDGK